jgi:hypothetical protein
MHITSQRVLCGLASAAVFAIGSAKADKQAGHSPPAHVIESDRNDKSPPLHDIRPNPPRAGELHEVPLKLLPNRPGTPIEGQFDPVVQLLQPPPNVPGTLVNFDGINNVDGVLPPDTVGDVGPNHYVQAVNLSFAIYDKSGALLYGPAAISTLWGGFGGACQNSNNGDPVVLYDHLADRWFISQFALPSLPFGPFYQCIAVSQTGDPLGGWHRYQFLYSNTKLNDYPKFGVWHDGYYMSVNQFSQGFSLPWAGQGVAVFERDRMLNGQTARMIKFDLYSTDSNLGGMLPSDLDGPPAAPGTPNYFGLVDDDALGYSPDQIQIWEFRTSWFQPNSSTFTKAQALGVAAFDSDMCGYARNCIPQPAGRPVDAIADRLMFRLQFRNFGNYQVLMANHTTDSDSTDHAGVRWYELRKAGGPWNIEQQGTYAPDAHHRWMASIAMDGAGDIGLGFSISSSTLFPSIKYAGRLPGDPLGLLSQGESFIIEGSGSQSSRSGRWGDYSAMVVDPTDDCTFWYTQEYYAGGTSNSGWRTRVGSFKFPSCVPPPAAMFHVADLDRSSTAGGNAWTARATVRVHDDGEVFASGATVSGTWSVGAGGISVCTTNLSGQCTLTTRVGNNNLSTTFTVLHISRTSATYNAAANHDPDGDSNGTSITVNKP